MISVSAQLGSCYLDLLQDDYPEFSLSKDRMFSLRSYNNLLSQYEVALDSLGSRVGSPSPFPYFPLCLVADWKSKSGFINQDLGEG